MEYLLKVEILMSFNILPGMALVHLLKVEILMSFNREGYSMPDSIY